MTDTKEYKIGFFGVKSWEKEIIEKEINRLPFAGVGLFEEEVQDKIEIASKYDVISPFVYSKMTKEVLDKLPNLKMVATRSTGIDHVDVKECENRGIVSKNVPVYGSHTVAEYAMALLLAVTKKIVISHQSVENGEFSPEGLTGIDLFGKTLGVVGTGKIGQNMITMGKGFGMNIVAYDAFANEEVAKQLGFKYVDIDTLLKTSDFVSLHVPYIPETYHLINRNNIKSMKKGSYLINTSRGPIVEAEAIVWALNNKILAGVGLDVIEEESEVENISVLMSTNYSPDDLREILSFHMLRDRDDVVFTPHNAFNTQEAIERIVATTIDNILEFINQAK